MNEKIKQSLQFIEQYVCENITLKRIADSAFSSPRHFHRLFKKHTGKSPAKYIEQKKMEKAILLLQLPDMLITDIADTLGYRNYETFSGRFKQYYKISPGDLKNILDSIRIRRNERGNNLNFHIISSEYKNIAEKLNCLNKTLANDNKIIETFIVAKSGKTGVLSNTKMKYRILKYDNAE